MQLYTGIGNEEHPSRAKSIQSKAFRRFYVFMPNWSSKESSQNQLKSGRQIIDIEKREIQRRVILADLLFVTHFPSTEMQENGRNYTNDNDHCASNSSGGCYSNILEHGWEPGWVSTMRDERGHKETHQNGPMKPHVWRTKVTNTPILAASWGKQSMA